MPRAVSTKSIEKYRDTFGIAIPKSIEAYAIPVSSNLGIAIYRSIVSIAQHYSSVRYLRQTNCSKHSIWPIMPCKTTNQSGLICLLTFVFDRNCLCRIYCIIRPILLFFYLCHLWLPDTSATRHFGIKTLWDTSAPVSRHFDTKNVVYETLRHECRVIEEKPEHFDPGQFRWDTAPPVICLKLRHQFCGAEVSCGRSVRLPHLFRVSACSLLECMFAVSISA